MIIDSCYTKPAYHPPYLSKEATQSIAFFSREASDFNWAKASCQYKTATLSNERIALPAKFSFLTETIHSGFRSDGDFCLIQAISIQAEHPQQNV